MTAEQKEKLASVNLDEGLLADDDGNVLRNVEIEFIIKDVLKHQLKSFKLKRKLVGIDETIKLKSKTFIIP